MSPYRRFLSDTRGASIVLFALAIGVIALIVAIVANLGLVYLDKRKFQGAADIAAIQLAQAEHPNMSALRLHLEEQGLNLQDANLILQRGRYHYDADIAPEARFTEDNSDWNAVRVDVRFPIEERVMASALRNDNFLSVHAVAAQRQTAAIYLGSRLLRLEGGLSGALLNALLGYEGRISVMDYNQLVDIDIDLLTMIEALETGLDVDGLSYNDVLSTEITLGQLVAALDVSGDPDQRVVGFRLPNAFARRNLRLADVIRLGRAGNQTIETGRPEGSFGASAGELLFAAAALANGDRQIELDLAVADGLVGLELDIGDPEKFMQWNYSSNSRTTAQTAQTDLGITLLDGSEFLNTEVSLQLAQASARMEDVVCDAARNVQAVHVEVETSPAELVLRTPILRTLRVDLSSGSTEMLEFTPEQIANGETQTVNSGLGVNLNGVPLLYRPLTAFVSELLEELGLFVGEADVRVTDASCTRAYLVD